MAYVYPNYKTKKALKEAVNAGKSVEVVQLTPWGADQITEGEAVIEGPHYPEPHRWYAKVKVKGGVVISVK